MLEQVPDRDLAAPWNDAWQVLFERARRGRSVPSCTSCSTIVAVNVFVTLPMRKRWSAPGRREPAVATYSLPAAETKTIRLLAPVRTSRATRSTGGGALASVPSLPTQT